MLNWHFEGSNDKVNWTVLDRRLYLTGNPAEDAAFEEEKKLLCAVHGDDFLSRDQEGYDEPGTCYDYNTWGVITSSQTANTYQGPPRLSWTPGVPLMFACIPPPRNSPLQVRDAPLQGRAEGASKENTCPLHFTTSHVWSSDAMDLNKSGPSTNE